MYVVHHDGALPAHIKFIRLSASSTTRHRAYPEGDYNQQPIPSSGGYPYTSAENGSVSQAQTDSRYAYEYSTQAQGGLFIPTPAQAILYQEYPGATRHRSQRPGSSNSSSRPMVSPPVVPLSQHYPSQMANAQATSTAYSSSLASSGERFVCVHCGASFGRAHDRKRHIETHHLASPPVHRCPHCRKEFGRGDSLKRHIANGCGGQ